MAYKLNIPLRRDGVTHPVGAVVDLDGPDADYMLAAGTAERTNAPLTADVEAAEQAAAEKAAAEKAAAEKAAAEKAAAEKTSSGKSGAGA